MKVTWPFKAAYAVRDFASRALGSKTNGLAVPEMKFVDPVGYPQTLFSYVGKDRGLVLWMTNLCEGCQEKIQFLEHIKKRYQNKAAVVAVSVLKPASPVPREVFRNHKFTFPLWMDPNDEVGKKLGFEHPEGACPFRNILIADSSKRIKFSHHLSAVSEEEFEKEICEIFSRS